MSSPPPSSTKSSTPASEPLGLEVGPEIEPEQRSLPGLEPQEFDARVLLVDSSRVYELMPLIGNWIRKANRYDQAADFVFMAANGEADLWTFWDKDFSQCLGVILTQPWQLKSGETFCQIIGIGGISIHRWIHLFSHVESYAATAYGAKRIRYWTDREAMKTVTPPGYRQVAVCLEKELS